MEETQFTRFKFKPYLIEAVKDLGFHKPTEIQERIIPSILNQESVIGQSQTGTGKTHAFLLPMMERIDPDKRETQAVITAPTRELAGQIYDEVEKLLKFAPQEAKVSTRLIVGGTDRLRTIEKLKQQPQIVIGTPGRIYDMVQENALQLQKVKTLVVDEADLMLDLGFIVDIDKIASRMPEQLQILVFSATIPEKLKPFLKKYMKNPKFTHIAPKQMTAANVEHVLIPLKNRDKVELIFELTKAIQPFIALIFANTRKMADEVADKLIEKGVNVGRMHGDLTPRERKKMMKQIRDLGYQFVVATDLAARGIDIQGVSHVINYELPKQELEFYIHRVGRTARAGNSGTAITIYQQEDEDALIKLEKMGIQFGHVDLKNGQLESIGPRNKRKARKQTENVDVKQAHSRIKKPNQVKPGYKKKRKAQIEKVIKQKKRFK